jgi:hypothetical protein
VSYLTVFFAIWWAWMNFSWFASAYDNDDGIHRLATLIQIAGALILAAGITRAFELRDFDVAFIGYVFMRTRGLPARHDRDRPAARCGGGFASGRALHDDGGCSTCVRTTRVSDCRSCFRSRSWRCSPRPSAPGRCRPLAPSLRRFSGSSCGWRIGAIGA